MSDACASAEPQWRTLTALQRSMELSTSTAPCRNASLQRQVGLQQQASGGLPPLAATSPELSGLLSQLLQHLSQVR